MCLKLQIKYIKQIQNALKYLVIIYEYCYESSSFTYTCLNFPQKFVFVQCYKIYNTQNTRNNNTKISLLFQ